METTASNSGGLGSTINSVVTTVIAWLNIPANALGETVFSPIAVVPGWLSATVIASIAGIISILIFKYTSNQNAFDQVRDDMKANLLAMKLFKDNMSASFKAQGGLFLAAFKLFVYGLAPGLFMLPPIVLIVAQMSLWYEAKPMEVKEAPATAKTQRLQGSTQPLHSPDQASIVLTHKGKVDLADVRLEVPKGIEIVRGPVRIAPKDKDHAVCWDIKAHENGNHKVVFVINGEKVEKDVAVGEGFQRVSVLRPSWNWLDVMLYPMEKPFPPDSLVQSIELKYPERVPPASPTDTSWWAMIGWFFSSIPAWGYSSGTWLIFFLVVSMAMGFIFSKVFGVNVGI